jgi:hypothetical protein
MNLQIRPSRRTGRRLLRHPRRAGLQQNARRLRRISHRPYSHTPWGSGARQPGMTGQVKEEILTRWGELGVSVQNGRLHFAPTLLRDDEFLSEPDSFTAIDAGGQRQTIALPANSLAFTFCQTPIIYTQACVTTRAGVAQIEVGYRDGHSVTIPSATLDATTSVTTYHFNRGAAW